jgi:hypothetical protein
VTVAIANEWAINTAQPSSFSNMPPALQSSVIALTPANSVGGGSGTPSSGNWLFCIAGWNQNGLTAATVGMGDDVHSFWRPGDVTQSLWAVSPSGGKTRTSAWYTPNLVRVAGDVYVAPDGIMAGIACLVIEVSGLGPWDTVTGIYGNYAAAATSLNLALSAPSAQAFLLGAACGDSDAVSQAFAPSGWTALSTVTATNGTDHTCDAVLTSAWITTTGSVSVSATTSAASDLSGVVIGVLTSAPSPVPGGAPTAWAGRTICEFAPGSGLETPPDQMTWVTLSDSASSTNRRLWAWADKGGIPYALGQLQSGSGAVQLDNADGYLSPSNVGSPWYSNALNSNMSFQSGVPPWTATGSAALAQSSAHVYASSSDASPNYSLQVTPNGTTATPGAASEQEAATAGSACSASAWFYSAAGYATGAQVAISWYNSSHTLISTVTATAVAIPAATWTQVTLLNQTAPANTAYAAVTVQFAGTPSATAYWVAEAALVSGASAVTTGLLTAGVPVRLRLALGTIKGVTYNRWYVISRYASSWTEKRTDKSLRSYVETGLTDAWSAASAVCATPYRGEIQQDNPGWWWPCDDQPLSGGVQPSSLRNAAASSVTALSICASGSGVSGADAYSTGGTDLTATGTNSVTPPLPSVAVAAAGQQQGWMYGDPQSSPASYATSNPVTSSPGSAAWQQTGLQGNTGAQTWYLAANDTYPALNGPGVTIKGWFNAGFAGSATGYTVSTSKYQVAAQPVTTITLCTLTTNSAPVCKLQLDTSGHLVLVTYNGTTGTNNTVYSSSDLRNASWMAVDIELTSTTWAVYVNGGLTASASGSATGMSNPTWFALNGDFGTGAASLNSSSIVHGGNVAYSHWAVFSGLLPKWRLLAHYNAAITGFGLLPAPQSLSLSKAGNEFQGQGYVPDGSEYQGSYGIGGVGTTCVSYSFSALAVAQAGSYTSGPSARAVSAGYGTDSGGTFYGDAVWLGLSALAPSVAVYTASAANAETNAATICGSGDSFTTGYGSSASGHGVSQTAAGTGASPPSSPSSLGDTVAQRLERILGYALITTPKRCIDPASLLVQAALDVGGQSAGSNVTAITGSDSGLWYTDNPGNLSYRSRPHLASDTAVWQIGPNVTGGQLPYDKTIAFGNDTQKVYTSILVTPYSPDGASLASLTPANATAVDAAQEQTGTRPLTVRSYLQSSSEQQSMTNWLFTTYGVMRRRVETLVIDAASHPAAWGLVAGGNVSDLAFVQDDPFGPPVTTGTYRITSLSRRIAFGANGNPVTASVSGDFSPEPTSYWS